jgi:hypothetical protein
MEYGFFQIARSRPPKPSGGALVRAMQYGKEESAEGGSGGGFHNATTTQHPPPHPPDQGHGKRTKLARALHRENRPEGEQNHSTKKPPP